MLENEGQRKQSLKRGLIELEDELDIGNERKERLMVTKISLIKRIIIPDVKKKNLEKGQPKTYIYKRIY